VLRIDRDAVAVPLALADVGVNSHGSSYQDG
jgi:hypothetical protein